jgi:hypothetical protein
MSNKKIKCTVCGSTHTIKNGTRKLATSIHQQYKCRDCDSYFFKKQNVQEMVPAIQNPRETQVSTRTGTQAQTQTTERRATRPSTGSESTGGGTTQGGACKNPAILEVTVSDLSTFEYFLIISITLLAIIVGSVVMTLIVHLLNR